MQYNFSAKSFFVALLAIPLFIGFPAHAAPGDPDQTFGAGGINIEYPWDGYGEYPIKIVARSNDSYSVVGCSDAWGWCLVDNGFGADDIAIQKDGKILVFGTTYSYPYVRTLRRLNSDWSWDTSFGNGGQVAFAINDHPFGIGLDDSGRIIVGDWFLNSPAPGAPRVDDLIRLKPDGTFDTAYGWAVIGDHQQIKFLVHPDSKVTLARYPNETERRIIRLNADGTEDPNFTPIDFAGFTLGQMELDRQGRLVVSFATGSGRQIRRYTSNGSLDVTFGNSGSVLAPGTALKIDRSGKILVAGGSQIWRLNEDGTLDSRFGDNGISDIGNGNISDLDLQPNGRILATAEIINNGFQRIAVARLLDSTSPFDFDGDGKSDISVFRPSNSAWYLNRSTDGFLATQFGLPTDRIVPADYDGDGRTDIAVYRDGVWWRINSSDATVNAVSFGIAGDIPVPADYTGDGQDELAVYRNGQWWTLDLSTGQISVSNFGLSTDKPVPADYDGDGRIDQAVYRNGEWHINGSVQGYTVINFGLATDRPVVGDYDADGRADTAVYRDGTWYVQQSTDGFRAFNWGLSTDIPAPADYDGDGQTDAAVYRNGIWYLWQSTSGISIRQFGLESDKPVPSVFLP